MKKILIILLLINLYQTSIGQSYFPFPTDTAKWNCLDWHQWSPVDLYLNNAIYSMNGDTIIKGKLYKKMFYTDPDYPPNGTKYIGGLREDSIKNIYFYPKSKYLFSGADIRFPNDTSEHLLYTFNNLDTSNVQPLIINNKSIITTKIDSVLIGTKYRKRYTIYYSLLPGEYWIEGIGSNQQLFSVYAYMFENRYYTLCFTDSMTYYINSPNGKDSCHFQVPFSVNEIEANNSMVVFPNPASETVQIDVFNKNGIINMYNTLGQTVLKDIYVDSKKEIDIRNLKPGIYILEFVCNNEMSRLKFIKK